MGMWGCTDAPMDDNEYKDEGWIRMTWMIVIAPSAKSFRGFKPTSHPLAHVVKKNQIILYDL